MSCCCLKILQLPISHLWSRSLSLSGSWEEKGGQESSGVQFMTTEVPHILPLPLLPLLAPPSLLLLLLLVTDSSRGSFLFILWGLLPAGGGDGSFFCFPLFYSWAVSAVGCFGTAKRPEATGLLFAGTFSDPTRLKNIVQTKAGHFLLHQHTTEQWKVIVEFFQRTRKGLGIFGDFFHRQKWKRRSSGFSRSVTRDLPSRLDQF